MLLHAFVSAAGQTGQGLGAAVDLHGRVANVLDHGRQCLAHLVERAGQLADFVVARHAQAHAQITGAQGFSLTYQIAQWREFAAQQPDRRSHRQQHRQQAADGQLNADAPGHGADFSFRHARHHRPRPVLERHGDAVEIFDLVAPELALARGFRQRVDGRDGLVQRLYASNRHQPFVLLIQQREGTGLADAEALEVFELGFLRVGVIETDVQHRNDLATAVAHRGVLRHVEAFKQQRSTHEALPRHQSGVSRVRVIEHSTDGAAAVLFGDVCADSNEVFTAAHKHRGHTRGHLLEFVHFLEVVVEHHVAQVQPRRLHACHDHRLVRVHAQPTAEARLEQPRQALGAFTQRAVKGAQLIGQQPGFTRQMLFAGGEVGRVQRTQGEQGTAGNDNRQYHGERKTKL
ncbi:hypothetical protein D3C87_1228660 [compost metagenome]